jgi:hypothetical protein
MNTKHTPGPWTRHEGEVRAKAFGLISRSYYGAPDGEGAANLRLIAAAPDLLGAVEFFMDMVGEPPEPNCSCHVAPPCNDCVDHAGLREAFDVARAAIAKATGGAI